MEPLQIIVVLAVLVVAGVGVVISARRIKSGSSEALSSIEDIVEEYIDDVILLCKDIILIHGIKREFCDSETDYRQILLRMVAERLVKLIYEDIEVDSRFKEIINEDTILPVLLYLYNVYEEQILSKVAEESEYIELPDEMHML